MPKRIHFLYWFDYKGLMEIVGDVLGQKIGIHSQNTRTRGKNYRNFWFMANFLAGPLVSLRVVVSGSWFAGGMIWYEKRE